MLKKFMTALLVAAMLLAATSISWGANGKDKDGGAFIGDGGGYSLLGATWE